MWPIFGAWIVNLIEDNYYTRDLVYNSALISAAGPFLLNWVGLFAILMEVFAWTDSSLWIWASVFFALTVGGMVMQLSLYD